MKNFTLALMFLLGVFMARTNAQSVLEVPPTTNGQPTALNKFIQDDSLAPPDRVYKLQRGAKYIFNQTCEISRSLRITSDSKPEDTPPAMVVASPDPNDGSLTELWFLLTGNNIDVDFSNVFFQGVAPTKEYVGAWLTYITGDTIRLKHDSTIFNGFGGGVDNITDAAEHVTFEVTNCIYRNIQFQNHPFMGQSLSNDATHTQVMVVKNNTFFNANSYVLFVHYLCDSLVFENNTLMGNSIQPVWNFYAVNASIKNNIFYAMHSLGVPRDAANEGWFKNDDGDTIPAIISLRPLPDDYGIDESSRKVVVTNNAYFVPKAIDDYWQKAIDNGWDSICVAKPLWISPYTQEMFDDDDNYPYLEIENNYVNVDPGFRQGIVDTIVEQRLMFDSIFAIYSWDMPADHPFHYAPNGDIFNVPWPLPEDLSYTNTDLLTGSTTGGPVGDPRWFGSATAIFSPKQASKTEGFLKQNYPNPFSNVTNITFYIENEGKAEINVYNIAGKKVATVVNQVYTPGTYTVQFNASKLPSGLYFYTMRTNGRVATRKMTIQK